MQTHAHRKLRSVCEQSCRASTSPCPKPALVCSDPNAPVRLLTPSGMPQPPLPARDLVSIDFEDLPFRGGLGNDPGTSPAPTHLRAVQWCNVCKVSEWTSHVISENPRTPDPPITLTPASVCLLCDVILCNIYSCFCWFYKCFGWFLTPAVIIPVLFSIALGRC